MARNSSVDARRAGIIAATVRVLARNGIGETTTRKIAAEAEVNQATLRYYFGSKDELLFAVLQEMMKTTSEVVQRGLAIGGEPGEILAESIRAFWSHVEEAPDLQIMQYELTLYALRNPQSAWLARQQYNGYSVLVETLLRQHFGADAAPDALSFADLARFIVAGLDGLILQFISNRDTARARHDLEQLIRATVALMEVYA